MTSGHFPEKLRRAGVPEFPDGPNTLCPHLFPVRVPGPSLLLRKVTVLSLQGLLTISFSSDFLHNDSILDIHLEARALAYTYQSIAGCIIYIHFLRDPLTLQSCFHTQGSLLAP